MIQNEKLVRIVQDSISSLNGSRILTYEILMHRFILAEFNTHRVFSRNSASSRAIPLAKNIEYIMNTPAIPVRWGKNQAGMQAKEDLNEEESSWATAFWLTARDSAIGFAKLLNKLGVHKQLANRLLEVWAYQKVVMTSTEFENWDWLRNDEEAQPEIELIAKLMKEEKENSTPFVLNPGEYHVPYVNRRRDEEGNIVYFVEEYFDGVQDPVEKVLTLQEALDISSSCSAQVSYRKLDDSLDKAQNIVERMINARRVHASPFEHQATPMQPTKFQLVKFQEDVYETIYQKNCSQQSSSWEEGITHVDRDGHFWSGNFKGWIQHRQLIPNNVRKG